MIRSPWTAVALGLACLGLAGPARAQGPADRYEVGRHLRDFEEALESQTDPAARTRALASLKNVTPAFFAGQLGRVAELLDRGRLGLASDKEPEPAVRWAQGVSVTLGGRLLDTHTPEVPISVRIFYKAGEQPAKASVRLTLTRDGKAVAPQTVLDLAELPAASKFPLKNYPEGDYVLRSELLADGKVLAVGVQGLSLVDRLDARLEKLAPVLRPADAEDTTDRATTRRLVGLLTDLRDGKAQETNYPAARLLVESEQAAAALAAGKPFYGQKKPGDCYLTLATKSPVPVRLRAPEAVRKGAPLPLVIALHGLGGTENLFFDGYGRGLAADLAASRGWLIVAPRNGMPADLIDAVDALYPVDRQRVFVVGHSMGAGQAVSAASANPERFAALAALGGGGRVGNGEKLRDVPFFVGVGTDDFSLSAARSLTANLEKAGVKKVIAKEYPGVEHLTVVQLALRDVFAFFDDAARARAQGR